MEHRAFSIEHYTSHRNCGEQHFEKKNEKFTNSEFRVRFIVKELF